jgi:RNA-directed DNA polymerase
MAIRAAALAASCDAVVNGPEGEDLDWDAVNWRKVEDDVRRLRQRIFTASQAGDLKKVRNLQKLSLRSRSNTLLSVRRVTEVNAGRETAGIDGQVVLLSQDKAELADWMQHNSAPWKAKPVKRVFIAKANGKQRGLGIPVIVDRALQARVSGALEPEWEARFEPKSYGFRPGRGCHDAIEAIYLAAKGTTTTRRWVLDADLTAAFDRIDHDHILGQLGTFPARGLVAQWLKAGVVDKGRFAPTKQGTPQGGVASPLLLNVALHGLEEAAGVCRQQTGTHAGETLRGSPIVVRYADDLVALCDSREQAEQVKQRLSAWLAPRGLSFNEDKTNIVHLDQGFDFLGFNVRRYGDKLLIKPSKAALRRIRERLSTEMRVLRGANAEAVVQKLNPIIRGWAAYYRHAVSSKAFASLDEHMWRLAYKWAIGDRDSGFYLHRFAWTPIIRHQMVKGTSSPDDPALTEYWAQRRLRRKPPLDTTVLRLIQAQHGECPRCGDFLFHASQEPQSPGEWEQWLKATRKAIRRDAITAEPGHGTPDESVTTRLIHAHCQRRHAAAQSMG